VLDFTDRYHSLDEASDLVTSEVVFEPGGWGLGPEEQFAMGHIWAWGGWKLRLHPPSCLLSTRPLDNQQT
jgi:hypothetical protein